jgi:hypothetical protein
MQQIGISHTHFRDLGDDRSVSNSIFRTRDITPDQIRQLLLAGGIESERMEFKREFGDGKNVLRTIAAMANGVGGMIVIGITDGGDERNREFFSIDPETAECLVNLCDTLLDPPFAPQIFELIIDEARVLAVRVEPTEPIVRPVVVREGAAGAVYVRRGGSTRKASPQEIRRLFAQDGAKPVLAARTGPILRPQIPNTWHTNRDIDLALQVTYEDRHPHGSGSLSTDVKEQLVDRLSSVPLTQASCFGTSPDPPSWTIAQSSSSIIQVTAELDHLPGSTRAQLRVAFDIAGVIVTEIEMQGVSSIEWTDLIDLVARAVASTTDSEIIGATWSTGWRPSIGLHLRAPSRGLRQVVSFPATWISHDGWSDIGADHETVWDDVSPIPIVTEFLEIAFADLGYWGFEADLRQHCARYLDD